ncbi:MAG TPA: helix-turn-helix transcriptional regulator [Pyrinomonadaceae bacterium]|jgi:transcriptional regulator with XRE-family HTH domain
MRKQSRDRSTKPSHRTQPKRLGKKLLQIRNGLHLSQDQILDRMGFNDDLFQGNISQYERGERLPGLLVILAYARIGGVSMEVLVDDKLELPRKLPGNHAVPINQNKKG